MTLRCRGKRGIALGSHEFEARDLLALLLLLGVGMRLIDVALPGVSLRLSVRRVCDFGVSGRLSDRLAALMAGLAFLLSSGFFLHFSSGQCERHLQCRLGSQSSGSQLTGCGTASAVAFVMHTVIAWVFGFLCSKC